MNPPIFANICEIDGPYFPVKLYAVPHVGELIDLTSLIDLIAQRPDSRHFYEVVQVRHELHDVPQDDPRYEKGNHSVSVFVKRSNSSYFN